MTRKDYEKFARMLKMLGDCHVSYDPAILKIVCEATADIFKEDNPHFDRARFLEACRPFNDLEYNYRKNILGDLSHE